MNWVVLGMFFYVLWMVIDGVLHINRSVLVIDGRRQGIAVILHVAISVLSFYFLHIGLAESMNWFFLTLGIWFGVAGLFIIGSVNQHGLKIIISPGLRLIGLILILTDIGTAVGLMYVFTL